MYMYTYTVHEQCQQATIQEGSMRSGMASKTMFENYEFIKNNIYRYVAGQSAGMAGAGGDFIPA